MKAFIALLRREYIEHRGAFLYGPLILVALLFGATLLAFTVGRIDTRVSGALFTAAPMRVYEVGFLTFGAAWSLYLLATLFFYCADGFAADKRNNAMLFWKSMPVSDFRMLLSKLVAAITVFPGSIFAITLLSGLLLFGVAVATSSISGTTGFDLIGSVAGVYVQVAAAIFIAFAVGLLWYLPFMALIGSLATAIGRWAIPVAALLPVLVSLIEWVTLGSGWNPLTSRLWEHFWYRTDLKLMDGYLETWFVAGDNFSVQAFATDLIARTDWLQVLYGAIFAVLCLFIASEYRRRSNANG